MLHHSGCCCNPAKQSPTRYRLPDTSTCSCRLGFAAAACCSQPRASVMQLSTAAPLAVRSCWPMPAGHTVKSHSVMALTGTRESGVARQTASEWMQAVGRQPSPASDNHPCTTRCPSLLCNTHLALLVVAAADALPLHLLLHHPGAELPPHTAPTRPAAVFASSGPDAPRPPAQTSCCLAGTRTGCPAVQTAPPAWVHPAGAAPCAAAAAAQTDPSPSCN